MSLALSLACRSNASPQREIRNPGQPGPTKIPSLLEEDRQEQVAAKQETPRALRLHLSLEEEINREGADKARRLSIFEQLQQLPDDGSPEYAYARAAVAGRVAEARGLSGLRFLREAESYATKSIERDPQFQQGSARRMLGSLYVFGGAHIRGKDSEDGLELLEDLIAEYPENPQNRLRLAEALVSLDDLESALEHLCLLSKTEESWTKEENKILDEISSQVRAEYGEDGCKE